jgi:hypothetical protein
MSHPESEMRLVSAVIGASYPFSLLRTLVHADFCLFPQSCDFHMVTAGSLCCMLDVLNACTHTGPHFIVSYEGCESHQSQVIGCITGTRISLSLIGLEKAALLSSLELIQVTGPLGFTCFYLSTDKRYIRWADPSLC